MFCEKAKQEKIDYLMKVLLGRHCGCVTALILINSPHGFGANCQVVMLGHACPPQKQPVYLPCSDQISSFTKGLTITRCFHTDYQISLT